MITQQLERSARKIWSSLASGGNKWRLVGRPPPGVAGAACLRPGETMHCIIVRPTLALAAVCTQTTRILMKHKHTTCYVCFFTVLISQRTRFCCWLGASPREQRGDEFPAGYTTCNYIHVVVPLISNQGWQ